MARKRYKPEEIVSLLRQAEVPHDPMKAWCTSRPATSETPTTQSGVGGTAICGSMTSRSYSTTSRKTASGSEAIDSMGPSTRPDR